MNDLAVSVVIPIHNEEKILRSTVAEVCRSIRTIEWLTLHELILSENGSTDSTLSIAQELAASDPAIKVLTSGTPDYGAAMKRAFLIASGDYIVNFDADYYNCDFLQSAIALDADLVIAAKNIRGSNDTRTLSRRLISRLFSALVRTLLGIRATETHAIKVYCREAIKHVLPGVEASQDLFDTELVARAEWSGLRVVEMPITTVEMRESRSGIAGRIPRTLIGLARLRLRLQRTAPPSAGGPVFPTPAEPSPERQMTSR